MELSARIIGFNSWSLLVPQALVGVGAVALLYATVRRVAGPGAAVLAGTALVLTPVATLMFRFDDPDALLTPLLVAAAYATTRAWEAADRRAGTSWLVLAGLVTTSSPGRSRAAGPVAVTRSEPRSPSGWRRTTRRSAGRPSTT